MTTDTTAASKSLVQTISLIGNAVLAVVVAAFAFLYIQANRDIETQKASVAALQTELAKEVARAAELKSDLNATRTAAQSLAEKSTQLQSVVISKEEALAKERAKTESAQAALEKEQSRLPVVPVRVEMRRSAMGHGLVAMLTNTSARQLPLLIATHNPTTKATKQFTLQVAPGLKSEIGYQEGWAFASGDKVLLRSAGFEDIQYTVP